MVLAGDRGSFSTILDLKSNGKKFRLRPYFGKKLNKMPTRKRMEKQILHSVAGRLMLGFERRKGHSFNTMTLVGHAMVTHFEQKTSL